MTTSPPAAGPTVTQILPPKPTPAPAAPAPEAKPKTPEALAKSKEVTSKFFETFGVKDKPPEVKAEPKAEEKPKPEPKAKPEPKELKAEEKKPEPKAEEDGFEPELPTPPRATRLAPEDLKSIVQEAVKGAVAGTQPKAEKKAEPDLPAKVTRKLPLLDVLEAEVPEHKGVRARTEAFYRKGGIEDEYKAGWQKENPGKKFNQDDEEHDEFYAAQDPLANIPEDDLEIARDALTTKRAEEIADRKISKAEETRQQSEAQERTTTRARDVLNSMALEAVAEMSPELGELAKTPEKLRTLEADNPLASHVLVQAVRAYEPAVAATIAVFGGVPFNPKDPGHQLVEKYGVELEDRIASFPVAQQMRGNQRFATISAVSAMPASERHKYWTIGANELLFFLGKKISGASKEQYTKLAPKAQVAAKNGQAPSETSSKEEEKTEETKGYEGSPSVGASAAAPPPGTPVPKQGSAGRGLFFAKFGVP